MSKYRRAYKAQLNRALKRRRAQLAMLHAMLSAGIVASGRAQMQLIHSTPAPTPEARIRKSIAIVEVVRKVYDSIQDVQRRYAA